MTTKKKPTNKKPAIKKKPSNDFDFAEFTGDQTKIPEDIARKLSEEGLVARWVNLGRMKQYGGRHPKGWVPYKIEKTEEEISLFGSGPSEYFQRGDLVLAVKTKENHSKHKRYLEYEAKQHSVKEMIKGNRKQFQDEINQQGLGDTIKVVDGYDE